MRRDTSAVAVIAGLFALFAIVASGSSWGWIILFSAVGLGLAKARLRQ